MDNSIGKVGSAATKLNDTNTARAVGSGSLDVFSTPMMIALMEQAACNALVGVIDADATTVGVSISVEHKAPTVCGKITATAKVIAVDGRRIDFELSACDESGEIGTGIHSRFIVNIEKFIAKANERVTK